MRNENAALFSRCLPVKTWIRRKGERYTERRLHDFGLSRRQAKICISKTKQKMRND